MRLMGSATLTTAALWLALVGVGSAQGDLAKALVGRWEGDVQLPGVADSGRTLMIQSVATQDGHWTGVGRFGITGKGLAAVTLEIDPSGPNVRFTVPGSGTTVDLTLTKDAKWLTGVSRFRSGSVVADPNRPIRLEKKE
jgi:hypothetical protein